MLYHLRLVRKKTKKSLLALLILAQQRENTMNSLYSSTCCLRSSLCLGRRLYSAGQLQTPLTTDPEWQSMIKNIECYRLQPPISQSQIKEKQHLYKIEKTMKQMVSEYFWRLWGSKEQK
jgi:hypothetical protein